MYKVSGYFRDHTVVRYFINQYDAIEFKDIVDAHYPLKVTYEKGVYPVSTFIVNCWNTIMDHNMNPLSNIPDLGIRHVVMQLLAWMWCIIFSMSVGSITVFGVSAVAHALFIAGVVITVGTFETARRKPQYFGGLGRGNGGEHE
jgi:hypothetical protein|tara:strand:- start:563 stop:994 length:432 start_codon:yes stop_codon:yes gene_type:complete